MSKEFDAWNKGKNGVIIGILGGLAALAGTGGILKHISSEKKDESNNKESEEIARVGSYSLHKDNNK